MRPPTVGLLRLLWVVFLLRVVGQLIVMTVGPAWLPPARQWYSGLIAYPYLLTSQVGILVLMWLMIVGLESGSPPLGPPSRRVSQACVAFSVPYYGFMVYRWVFRVLLNPERRWFDTLIPVVLHCVLATFLLIYGLRGIRRLEARALEPPAT